MITSAIYFCVKLGLLQLYPAYICYKAIKVNNQQEFGSLLTFWIVSITYLSIEYFSDIFLFWMPFYTELKLTIVLWLILPQTQGASVVYTRYLDPFLHSHEELIDNTLLEIQAKVKETIVLYGKKLIESIKKVITDTVFKGHENEQETTHSLSDEQTSHFQPKPASANGTEGYIINPYNLFSALVANAANRYQQQYTPSSSASQTTSQTTPPVRIEAPTPITSNSSTTSPTAAAAAINTAAEDNNNKLNRTDSHDSLQSYVNIKEGNSANTTPDLASQRPAPSEASTWGGYLASWIKRPSSSALPTDDKKQN